MRDTTVPTPKLSDRPRLLDSALFRYYAGYSVGFVDHLLRNSKWSAESTVLDPWNGSGTTTMVAARRGLAAIGLDLNPVMAIAAKARLLGPETNSSLEPLGLDIVRHAELVSVNYRGDEPLEHWFYPEAARRLRSLERAVHKVLIAESVDISRPQELDQLSSLASFYLVAIFRTVRSLVAAFGTSNPSWIASPKSKANRLRPSSSTVTALFTAHVVEMVHARDNGANLDSSALAKVKIGVGDSRNLPLSSNSVDCVITSPPYCTRLDYAVATKPELAVLGLTTEQFAKLRDQLIGTTTIIPGVEEPCESWGTACVSFLDQVRAHPSKSSRSYYWRNHLQYFDGLVRSLGELDRVMKPGAACTFVVQDSHYKNVHNDLPLIVTQVASARGWRLIDRHDFSVNRSLAHLRSSSADSTRKQITESVLQLQKPS